MSKSKGDWSWLREEFNISQLAKLLGIKRQIIDNWIRGRNDPDFLSTLKLATLVGSIEELERRAKVKIELSPLGNVESYFPLSILNDRNYAALIREVELLKYISRFDQMYARASKALTEIAGKDKFLTARLWFNKGYAELMLGYPVNATESANKARRLLPAKKDSILLADTYWFTGECLRVVGKLSEAYPHLEEAKKIYQRLDAKPSIFESGPVWLEWDLGRYFAAYGKYDSALNYFERMETIAKEIHLADAEVIAAWSRADIAEMKGEFSNAIANYFYAKGMAGLIGDTFWEAMALWRTAEAARRIFQSIGNNRMMRKADCVLAASYLQTGALDKASDLYNSAFDIFSETEDAPMERSILIGLGFLDLAYESQKPNPDYRKSLQAVMELEVKHRSIDDPYLNVYKDLACAEALRLNRRTDGALTRFDDVIKASNLYGYQLEKAHALLGVAAAKLLKGEADRESCIEAFKLYRQVGSIWGQVQSLITQSLIERDLNGGGTNLLQEAIVLARENSFFAKTQLIKSAQKEKHVLLFMQAV